MGLVISEGRKLTIWGLVLGGVTVAGLSFWLTHRAVQSPTTAAQEGEGGAAPAASAPSSGPAPSSQPVLVDTFGAASYSLARWTVDDSHMAGWIDTISVEPGGGLQVSSDDQVLAVGGWAGDPGVGIRTSTVVLTLCDTVVGAVDTGKPRPDVAAKVHPNLNQSGWQARLLVGHLPRCEGTYLEAWTLYPDSAVLVPLDGRIKIGLPPLNPAISLKGYTAHAPFAPDSVPPPRKAVTVDIDSTLALKRTPSRDGASLSQFPPGRYRASRLDEQDGWLLLVIDGKAGWAPRELVRISG